MKPSLISVRTLACMRIVKKEYKLKELLTKSVFIGLFVGVIGSLFLTVFSDYLPQNNDALVFAIFSGIAFIVIDSFSKKRITKSKVDR